MTSVEYDKKRDSSHEFNLYVDRQLQNKLLQVDEDSDTESYENKLSKPGSNLKSAARSGKGDSKVEDVTGWFPSAKFIARRPDGANLTRAETSKSNSFIHPWKDYRSKSKEDTFVFKHYTEHRKYIEQYRSEHGCQNKRQNMSGTPYADGRRFALRTASPQQQYPGHQQPQQQQGLWPSSAPSSNQAGIQYSNRRDQLGTLVTTNGNSNSSNCSCGSNGQQKQTYTTTSEVSSQQNYHRYKLSAGSFARTNTSGDLRTPHQYESENSSESGDGLRIRSASRRSNSATSMRNKPAPKAPTKISVPANPNVTANPRAYPIQALTIQQNCKQEVCPSPKPLDNLNCVAPEKQPSGSERRNVEQLELALRVHSINDLLTANDAPLRGYALPKSMPPHPNMNNGFGSEASDTSESESSDDDDDDADDSDDEGSDGDDDTVDGSNKNSDEIISLDQISTHNRSVKGMKIKRKNDQKSTMKLHQFFQDEPMLSNLNQRPDLRNLDMKQACSTCETVENGRAPVRTKIFTGDSFMIPQNDVDEMLRVNMWNPILSTVPMSMRNSPNYKNLMTPDSLRRGYSEYNRPSPIQNDLQPNKVQTSNEQVDFYNQSKNIRFSITRLDNAVSFCRTHVPSPTAAMGRKEKKGGDSNGSKSTKEDNSESPCINYRTDGSEQYPMKWKPQIHDPFVDKLIKPTKFEQKLLPLPSVKILESVPSNEKDTGSLATRRQPSAKKRVDFDLRPKSFKEYSHKPDESKRKDLSVGSQCVSLEPPFSPRTDKYTEKNNGTSSENSNPKDKTAMSSTNGNSLNDDKYTTSYGTPTKTDENPKENNPLKSINSLHVKKMALDGKSPSIVMPVDQKSASKSRETHSRQKEKLHKKAPIASGKHLRSCPELEGLTWSEKLEVLRSVNKPPDRQKAKPPKIKYIKAGEEQDSETGYLWSGEHEHLYEQRRIRHLVEQARLKGGKKLDWVYEAQVRARGIDWNTGRLKPEEGVPNGVSASQEKGSGDAQREHEKVDFELCVTPKSRGRPKLFSS